jgi:branched-chain amino acid transport system substrate-binding protein
MAAVLAPALLLAGCGGGGRRIHRLHGGPPARPPVVHVYVSVPGGNRSPLFGGALLAYEQDGRQAGRYRVVLRVRDSSRNPGRNQPPASAQDAREAATDQQAVLFIGGASDSDAELSVPILNLATIPEISVGSTYVGLTEHLPPVTGDLEPNQYYPSGVRTLVRLLPNQAVQAAADMAALGQVPCQRLAVAEDGSDYGRALAGLVSLARPGSDVDIVSNQVLPATSAALRSYIAGLHGLVPTCFAYFGENARVAVGVVRAVHLALPLAPILVPDRLCSARFADPALGGVPAALAPLLLCTSPWLPLGAYPGGRAFAAAYRAAYRGRRADTQAILGYEAMKLGLHEIAALGPQGDDRAALVRALHAMAVRRSVIGAYRFDPAGDTTLHSVGLFRVSASSRRPVLKRVLSPARVP